MTKMNSGSKREGKVSMYSVAVLSCPVCFPTLCLDCQRHEKYLTQYGGVFVVNCKINNDQVSQPGMKRKRDKKGRVGGGGTEASATSNETFKPVCCSVCSTEVGVIDEEEICHFFNVLPSD